MANKRKDMLEIMKAHAVQMRMDADDDGQWITTENGHHVHLNSEGVPDKGNPHVLAAMSGKGGSGGKGSGEKKEGAKSGSKSALKTYREHEWGKDPAADHKVAQETLRSGDRSAIAAKMSDDADTLVEYGDDPDTLNGILSDYYAAGKLDDMLDEVGDDIDMGVSLSAYRNHEWGKDEDVDRFMAYRTLKYGDATAVREKMGDDMDTLYELGRDDPAVASGIIEGYKAAGMYDKLKSEYESTFEEELPSGSGSASASESSSGRSSTSQSGSSSPSGSGSSGSTKLPGTMDEFKGLLSSRGIDEKGFWDLVMANGGNAIQVIDTINKMPPRKN